MNTEYVLVPREPTEEMMSAWFNQGAKDGRIIPLDEELREAARTDWNAMLAAAPALPAASPAIPVDGQLACTDCGRTYGSEHWADFVIPDDAWLLIGPTGHSGGVLCVQCMIVRANKLGVKCVGQFTSGPFADKDWRKPALTTVDDDAQDTIDEVLNRLESWGKAYPEDVFPPVTDAEREWLHSTRRGLMDRISASMGRHMAKCIAEDLAKLRAALSGPIAQEDDK